MKLTQSIILMAISCVLTSNVNTASAQVYTVPATDNIFSAGLSTPVAPGGGGAGTLPAQITLSSGQNAFQFQVSGTDTPNINDPSLANLTAEGTSSWPTDLNPVGGISGYMGDYAFPLVGVFLSVTPAQAPPPPTLNFSAGAIGRNFLSLSPAIGQVFFIGNGLTDSNQAQTFYAPAGATLLFLGLPDGYDFAGDPGQYQDNAGSLNVSVNAVPEPAPIILLLAGSVTMAAIRYRNKR